MKPVAFRVKRAVVHLYRGKPMWRGWFDRFGYPGVACGFILALRGWMFAVILYDNGDVLWG